MINYIYIALTRGGKSLVSKSITIEACRTVMDSDKKNDGILWGQIFDKDMEPIVGESFNKIFLDKV